MKAIRIIAAFVTATLLVSSCGVLGGASSTAAAGTATTTPTLTNGNGLAAGLALLNLYSQYKKAGSIELNNTSNVNNLVNLANNIAGVTKQTTVNAAQTFVDGMVTGSKNLVNSSNAATVLNTLAAVNNLDINSIASSAASAAATNLINKAAGTATSAVNTATTQATTKATGLLSTLFSKLKQ